MVVVGGGACPCFVFLGVCVVRVCDVPLCLFYLFLCVWVNLCLTHWAFGSILYLSIFSTLVFRCVSSSSSHGFGRLANLGVWQYLELALHALVLAYGGYAILSQDNTELTVGGLVTFQLYWYAITHRQRVLPFSPCPLPLSVSLSLEDVHGGMWLKKGQEQKREEK